MDESQVIHLENLLQVLPEEMHDTLNMLAGKCGTKGKWDYSPTEQ